MHQFKNTKLPNLEPFCYFLNQYFFSNAWEYKLGALYDSGQLSDQRQKT